MAHGTQWVGLDAARMTALMAFGAEGGLVKGEAPGVPIVMGLDQHRAQITAEWIDLETGEVSRRRVAPADRAAVKRFLGRFAGRRAGGCVGGDDGLAVRGRGAGAGGRRGVLGGAGGHARAARPEASREDRPGGRAASARAAGSDGCPSRGSRPGTSSISAPGSAAGTRSRISGPSGSSRSSWCSTTTAPRTSVT